MARIILVCILIVSALGLPTRGSAQESLRTLTGMAREQVLNWSNPALEFDLNIPPGANAATLTLFADPGERLPANGSMMIVSINGYAGIEVNPRPEAFSARIDLSAKQLRAGKNSIRISFEGARVHSCPVKADGGWRLDLARSRFDLSISANIASFETLEGWLSGGPWALSRVSISQGTLSKNTYAAFGALIAQGLAIRANRVPQIVARDRIAGVDFTTRIDSGFAGPTMTLRPGVRPVVEFQGRDEDDILAMARLFASRMIQSGGTRATPALLARAPLVRSAKALDGIIPAMAQPSWNARPYVNMVRVPHNGKTRLVVEMERPDWVSPDSAILISVDGEKPVRKRLKHTLNHFIVPLSRNSMSVVRAFSIARQARPSQDAIQCVEEQDGAPLRLLSARIESNGYAFTDALSRFAVDGAPFVAKTGAATSIVLASDTPMQLYAAWRALARIALVSGVPMTAAWYGTDTAAVPDNTALMMFGPRHLIAPSLMKHLPQVFAAGAAAGPGDYEMQFKKPRLSITRAAFADEAGVPPGLGVAGWGRVNLQPVLILTGDRVGDFIPAMQALADGPAINFFAGRVVRWRAGLVEINDIGSGSGSRSRTPEHKIPAILFIIAGICLIGLWISLWRRLYSHWYPA